MSTKTKRSNKPACAVCHSKKCACDGARPCGRCVRLGKQALCVEYQPKKRGRKPKFPSSIPEPHVAFSSAPCLSSSLASLLNIPPQQIQALETQLQQLQTQIQTQNPRITTEEQQQLLVVALQLELQRQKQQGSSTPPPSTTAATSTASSGSNSSSSTSPPNTSAAKPSTRSTTHPQQQQRQQTTHPPTPLQLPVAYMNGLSSSDFPPSPFASTPSASSPFIAASSAMSMSSALPSSTSSLTILKPVHGSTSSSFLQFSPSPSLASTQIKHTWDDITIASLPSSTTAAIATSMATSIGKAQATTISPMSEDDDSVVGASPVVGVRLPLTALQQSLVLSHLELDRPSSESDLDLPPDISDLDLAVRQAYHAASTSPSQEHLSPSSEDIDELKAVHIIEDESGDDGAVTTSSALFLSRQVSHDREQDMDPVSSSSSSCSASAASSMSFPNSRRGSQTRRKARSASECSSQGSGVGEDDLAADTLEDDDICLKDSHSGGGCRGGLNCDDVDNLSFWQQLQQQFTVASSPALSTSESQPPSSQPPSSQPSTNNDALSLCRRSLKRHRSRNDLSADGNAATADQTCDFLDCSTELTTCKPTSTSGVLSDDDLNTVQQTIARRRAYRRAMATVPFFAPIPPPSASFTSSSPLLAYPSTSSLGMTVVPASSVRLIRQPVFKLTVDPRSLPYNTAIRDQAVYNFRLLAYKTASKLNNSPTQIVRQSFTCDLMRMSFFEEELADSLHQLNLDESEVQVVRESLSHVRAQCYPLSFQHSPIEPMPDCISGVPTLVLHHFPPYCISPDISPSYYDLTEAVFAAASYVVNESALTYAEAGKQVNKPDFFPVVTGDQFDRLALEFLAQLKAKRAKDRPTSSSSSTGPFSSSSSSASSSSSSSSSASTSSHQPYYTWFPSGLPPVRLCYSSSPPLSPISRDGRFNANIPGLAGTKKPWFLMSVSEFSRILLPCRTAVALEHSGNTKPATDNNNTSPQNNNSSNSNSCSPSCSNSNNSSNNNSNSNSVTGSSPSPSTSTKTSNVSDDVSEELNIVMTVNTAFEEAFGYSQKELRDMIMADPSFLYGKFLSRDTCRSLFREPCGLSSPRPHCTRMVGSCITKSGVTRPCILSVRSDHDEPTIGATCKLVPNRYIMTFDPLPPLEAENPHNLMMIEEYLRRQNML